MTELTTAEAAELLGVDTSTVARLARAGDLPHARRVGTCWLFDERAVRRLRDKRAGETRPGRPPGKRGAK